MMCEVNIFVSYKKIKFLERKVPKILKQYLCFKLFMGTTSCLTSFNPLQLASRSYEEKKLMPRIFYR